MLGLLFGSTFNIFEIRILNSFEKQDGIGLYWALTIFIDRVAILFPSKGIFRQHISYNSTPNDQISDLKE